MTLPGKPDAPVVSILTLGCKLNQADSEAVARCLAADGVNVVDRPTRGASAFVINTCSVTHAADSKARHAIRLARRLSPDAEIVLTGCYAETAPPGLAEELGADRVVPNSSKPAIAKHIIERLQAEGDISAGCSSPRGNPLRTRAFVKIQEGCNELCAFCIVPYTRGREVSVPIEEVVREVQAREAEGVVEVVLTGTQLGNYGRDLGWPRPEQGPRRLLAELLDGTNIPRIRMSSLQAQDITPQLLRLWNDPRLCPHFHVPLQSGSDAVLASMRRRYTAEQFRRAVAMIREQVPDVAITTDVIAGFPGETDADFEATLSLCEQIGFAGTHCFRYSRRPHTGAEMMRGHLPPHVRRARLDRLHAVANESSATFRRGFDGRVMDVLWERQSGGLWQGLTGNYIRAYTSADSNLENRLLPVRMAEPYEDGVRAEILDVVRSR